MGTRCSVFDKLSSVLVGLSFCNVTRTCGVLRSRTLWVLSSSPRGRKNEYTIRIHTCSIQIYLKKQLTKLHLLVQQMCTLPFVIYMLSIFFSCIIWYSISFWKTNRSWKKQNKEMAVRVQFENSNEVGVFSKLTNAYCLVGIGASENFYRWAN